MPLSVRPHTPTASYQSPLTPVSEADSDTTETASTSVATSSPTTSRSGGSVRSYFYERPLNFSRPRPVDYSPAHKVHHDSSDSCGTPGAVPRIRHGRSDSSSTFGALPRVHTFGAFDSGTLSPSSQGPSDFDPDNVRNSIPDGGSIDGFIWDDHLEDIKPFQQRDDNFGTQRSRPRALYKPEQHDLRQPHIAELHGSIPQGSVPQGSVPQGSVPQGSISQSPTLSTPGASRSGYERSEKPPPPSSIPAVPAGEEDCDGEDVKSHHTVSENGDIAELESSPWMSSSYDVSSLKESEVKKLRKRGINPALYAEMKAARRGKGKWINPLVGNTYLS